MKRLVLMGLLVFVGFAGWRAGGLLSTDAMSMAVGIVFGVLASVPAALLILVATRRHSQAEAQAASRAQHATGPSQMPIVVMAPPAYPGFSAQAGNPYAQLIGQQPASWAYPPQPARPERVFTIVGEEAEYMDDF